MKCIFCTVVLLFSVMGFSAKAADQRSACIDTVVAYANLLAHPYSGNTDLMTQYQIGLLNPSGGVAASGCWAGLRLQRFHKPKQPNYILGQKLIIEMGEKQKTGGTPQSLAFGLDTFSVSRPVASVQVSRCSLSKTFFTLEVTYTYNDFSTSYGRFDFYLRENRLQAMWGQVSNSRTGTSTLGCELPR